MGFIAWIVVGAIAGFLANQIMGSRQGLLMMVVLGIVGGLVGGFVAATVLKVGSVNGINIESIVIATRRRAERSESVETRHTAMRPGIPASADGGLLELIRGSDSVELKATVPASDQRASIARLPMDPVEAQPRQVFFFDTPDLLLNQAGVVVRARRRQGGRGDTVVKLRPVVPSDLPPDIRRSPAFNVEVDVLPGGFVCSGSMKGRVTGQEVRDAAAGTIPLRSIFSKEQRAFYKAHAPAGIELASLVTLGPTFILKAVFAPKTLGDLSSRRCGSTRTDRGSSSCRPSACRRKPSRSRRRRAPTWAVGASPSAATSRRRRRRPSSSSLPSFGGRRSRQRRGRGRGVPAAAS